MPDCLKEAGEERRISRKARADAKAESAIGVRGWVGIDIGR